MAAGASEGRFLDLKFNQFVGIIERSAYLVKVSAAQKQIVEEQAAQPAPQPQPGSGGSMPVDGVAPPPVSGPADAPAAGESAPAPQNTHFYMSAELDTTRINRDVQRLVEEVISHLTSVDGAQVEVSLEVNLNAPGGLSQQTVRTVSENCRTLKVKDFGFDG